MKKYFFYIFIILILFSCSTDRLREIRILAKYISKNKDEELKKKIEGSVLYKEAIDTLVEAYSQSFSLNKDIATRLINIGSYEKALEHLKIAESIKPVDKEVHYKIGVCYVNLYKIYKNRENLIEAEKHYEISLNIDPKYKDLYYDYAQLLVFGTQNYPKAITLLNKYLIELNVPDKDGYFLLGRAYYMNEELDKAKNTFIYIQTNFEKQLSKEEKEKLEEFIIECSINKE